MQQRKRIMGVVSVSFGLVALVALGQVYADDDEEVVVPKQIREAVNKMADDVGKGNKVDKDATAFFKDNKGNLKKTMWVFKPREAGGKGGLGIGKRGTYKPDGIELFMLNQLGPKPTHTLNLKASAADLNRLVDITLAMSEITVKYVPTKPVGKKTPELWKETNADMKKAALTLKAAIKSGNKADVKQAFGKLAASCNRCHTTFRDD